MTVRLGNIGLHGFWNSLVIAGLTRNLLGLPEKYDMNDNFYIYFLTNSNNKVLYLGVTNNITRRVTEHKVKINKSFTYKYNCDKLVYYEVYPLVTDAIAREKQLKNWKREWKNKLVDDFNPEWKDLSEIIGVNDEYLNAVRAEYSRHSIVRDCGSSPQ